MKVCFAVLHHDTTSRDPAAYLDEVPLHQHLPQAVAEHGHEVSVVHLFPVSTRHRDGRVDHHFVVEAPIPRWVAGAVGRALGRPAALYEPALRTLARIRSMEPDVVHVHGTSLHLNLALLRLFASRDRTPVVLHYHGGYPAAHAPALAMQRFGFAGVRRFLFTTRDHATPFVAAGLIRDPADVVPFMETSSHFSLRSRADCRRETGMSGTPVFVWTGRLHPIKDPMTALEGFEYILRDRPEAQLYMYYRTTELLPGVQAWLAARPHLDAHVHLRGRAPYAQMEAIYNSADFFVQASHREFSGCAVLEAMSCGAVPVVTDLPSFRAMTDDGRLGVLFPPGDATAMARHTLALPAESAPGRAAAVRAHFDRALSYPALAAQLDEVYRDVRGDREKERR